MTSVSCSWQPGRSSRRMVASRTFDSSKRDARQASRSTRWEAAKASLTAKKLLNAAGAITIEGRNLIGFVQLFDLRETKALSRLSGQVLRPVVTAGPLMGNFALSVTFGDMPLSEDQAKADVIERVRKILAKTEASGCTQEEAQARLPEGVTHPR